MSKKINGFMSTSLLLTPNGLERTYFIQAQKNYSKKPFKGGAFGTFEQRMLHGSAKKWSTKKLTYKT